MLKQNREPLFSIVSKCLNPTSNTPSIDNSPFKQMLSIKQNIITNMYSVYKRSSPQAKNESAYWCTALQRYIPFPVEGQYADDAAIVS